jgi:hypothetical protein
MVGYFDTVETITSGVVVFFALIALITIIRIILRREETSWRGIRVGFFIERHGYPRHDSEDEDDGQTV